MNFCEFEDAVNYELQNNYDLSLHQVFEVCDVSEELEIGMVSGSSAQETADEVYQTYSSYFDNTLEMGFDEDETET